MSRFGEESDISNAFCGGVIVESQLLVPSNSVEPASSDKNRTASRPEVQGVSVIWPMCIALRDRRD